MGAQEWQGQRGQPATARLRRAWAAWHGPNRGGTGVFDAWAPVGSGREKERRGAGPAQKKGGVGRARMNRKVFDLFN
jgi:hypothetical protein